MQQNKKPSILYWGNELNSENLYEKKKKKKNYGKRVTPIASIIDWIPKTIIATPPKISI